MPSQTEIQARERLASNGRNPANNNAGIRVGSDLHLCEMLLSDIEALRAVLIGVDHTLTVHGHIDAGTDLHKRVQLALAEQ